ncbi:MAG: hypothetical protein N2595_03230 [bacterium]|nr:hypothetical protein [bacterium]
MLRKRGREGLAGRGARGFASCLDEQREVREGMKKKEQIDAKAKSTLGSEHRE